jgi:NAD(P)-dependent dehydrogenase (short-subunit alcohol dehydrogenase family)
MQKEQIKDTVQVPIHSGFGPLTTSQQVMGNRSLKGKTIIQTGGYSGIGREVTRVFAQSGATVIIPAHSVEKAKTALQGLPNIEIYEMDLIHPDSIDAFSKRFLASGRPLHILINGAGIMATPLRRDARGYELQFATNHLGHFQLTARLWPALKAAKSARVVVLSSFSHHMAAVNFEDPNFEHREYEKWNAYAQSKSANALFAVGLDKKARKYNVRAFALHPGIVPETDLGRDLKKEELPVLPRDEKGEPIRQRPGGIPLKTVEEGASTTVWCAVSEQLNGMGGVYCQDVDIAEAVQADSKSFSGVWPWAIDPFTAEKLWGLSEQLTGVKFLI